MTPVASRPSFLGFALMLMLLLWLIPIGLTFNGVIALVDAQPMTLALLALMTVLWGVGCWRGAWRTYGTPFDLVFFVGMVVIGLSIIANLDSWRRSAEALWYVILYAVFFYVLADLLANRVMTRARILIALLIVGGLLLAGAITQVVSIFIQTQTLVSPVSFLGNPNAFGNVLATLTVASFAFAIMQKTWHKRLLVYSALCGVLLVLTFSRGALVGALAGLMCVGMSALYLHQRHTPQAMLAIWSRLSMMRRVLVGVGIATALTGFLLLSAMLVQSLSVGGRSIDNRTFLWECALTIFIEQPLTGSGLFTYGRTLPLCEPIPPQQPHSHPHSLPLLVLSEMGIGGAFVLIWALIISSKATRARWRNAPQDRPVLVAGACALIASFVHHNLDMPSMMPAVALWNVILLAIATLPTHDAPPMQSRTSTRAHIAGLSLTVVALLVTAFWANNLHQQYRTILSTTLQDGNWREGAVALQDVLQADPANSAYRLQVAYLWGMASAQGDGDDANSANSANSAIEHYEAYLRAEPYHTANWSNLAALYWQIGDAQNAQRAIARAQALAPTWAHYERQRQLYHGEVSALPDVRALRHSLSRDGANYARFQFLRDIATDPELGEYLPQVGWGD